MKKTKSILQKDRKTCFICGRYMERGIHEHHVFGGSANRSKSTEWGLVVSICPYHHNTSNNSVHGNAKMREELQAYAQKKFEELYGHDKFMEVFHKNYIKEKTHEQSET